MKALQIQNPKKKTPKTQNPRCENDPIFPINHKKNTPETPF